MHDRRSAEKRHAALDLFRRHSTDRTLVLSTQVLQEFFVTITEKIARLPVAAARTLVADYSRLNVVSVQSRHVLEAIDIKGKFRLSFRDSLDSRCCEVGGSERAVY